MTKRYFVKFVKPSMNTLCSILNRNLWLSSPIYLNDPDEYWFETQRNILVHNNPHDINDAEIQKNLKKMLEETKEIKRIIDMIA